MPQTVNGQNTSEKDPQRSYRPTYRPGQRQQERMQRLARRRKRQRIVTASILAFVVVAAGIAGTILYQNYNAQQATLHAHATATADAHASATARVLANATATVVTKNCFISPDGSAVPEVYAGTGTPTSGPTTTPALKATPLSMSGGLKYVDIKVGTGATVKDGSTITANYTGWLASTCQKFDSSYDSHSGQAPAPFTSKLAEGQLIQGWVEGLVGMKAGGIRRLYIPSALGYGSQAQGSTIPANSNLIFDVQIVSVK